MKIVVETEQRGRDWFATCAGLPEGEHGAEAPVGQAGPKNSEAAAASGAIGDYFQQRLAAEAEEAEFEYQPASREGGRKFAVEYRSSPLETWSTLPYRLDSREAAEAKIAELQAEDR